MLKILIALLFSVTVNSWSVCPVGSTVMAVPSVYATNTLAVAAIPVTPTNGYCVEVSGSATYSEYPNWTGFTTSAVNYLYWTTAASAYHGGVFGVGPKLLTGVPAAQYHDFGSAYMTVDGLEFEGAAVIPLYATKLNFTFKNNLVTATSATNGQTLQMWGGANSNNNLVFNNVFRRTVITSSVNDNAIQFNSGTTAGSKVYNNTTINYDVPYRTASASVDFVNNIAVQGNGQSNTPFTGGTVMNYNACNRTCVGANSLATQTFAWVDSAGGNFHLSNATYNALGVAVTGYTTDIDGNTVGSPPQISHDFFFQDDTAAGSSSGCGGRLWRMGLAPRCSR